MPLDPKKLASCFDVNSGAVSDSNCSGGCPCFVAMCLRVWVIMFGT